MILTQPFHSFCIFIKKTMKMKTEFKKINFKALWLLVNNKLIFSLRSNII